MVTRQTAAPAATAAGPAPSPREWLGLIVLLAGTFVAQVDFFIVNVALPSIQRDLHATLSEVQLVAVSYGGAYAVAVVTGGRLGDLFGRKRMFVGGLVAFAGASLLAGLSWSGWVLVAARVVQGLAAALVMPQSIGSLHAMFTGRARDRAFSIFGVSMGLAWVSGIFLGGILVGANIAHLGWRAIFLINVPLAGLALVGALTTLTESRRPSAAGLDPAGMGLFALVVAFLVVPLIQGRQAGWPGWTYLCLVLAVAAGAAMVWTERRVLARGRSPVISPELFSDRNFRFGLLVVVVFFLGPPGFFLLTTLYLQTVLGFSALAAGLTLLPFGAVFVVTSYGVKRLKERFGERVLVAGVAVMMVGLLVLAGTIELAGTHATVPLLAPGVALIGLGQALVTTPLYELLLRNVPKDIAATASGVFTTVQLVAQSLSVALLVIVFAAAVGGRFAALSPDRAARLRTELVAAGASPSGATAATAAYRTCGAAAARSLAGGATVHCGGPDRWRSRVDAAASATVADAARTGYALTMTVNLAVLLASGAIIAVRLRRHPRDATPEPRPAAEP